MKKFYSALKILCIAALIVSLISLASVVVYVLINGGDKLSFDLLFGKYRSDSPSVFPAFIGTLQLIFIASIVAVPVGVASAVFLVEYTNSGSKFVRVVQVATETLAGIPSIVYGLFGYLIFVVAFGWGYSMLGGGITLAIMILPTIVRSTQESLLAVQAGLRDGAYALGASKVRTIFKIVLPSAAGGIVTAIILAVGRVISE
ncbi:MAG: phosphate ABC transporter permease PstA, partial [Eubacteriales bacterium]